MKLQKKEDNDEVCEDPLVVEFALSEAEGIMRNVELRLLVERMASKYNLSKDCVRKAVVSVLKSAICTQIRN